MAPLPPVPAPPAPAAAPVQNPAAASPVPGLPAPPGYGAVPAPPSAAGAPVPPPGAPAPPVAAAAAAPGTAPLVRRPRRMPRFAPAPSTESTGVIDRKDLLARTRGTREGPRLSQESKMAGNLPAWCPLPPHELIVHRAARTSS